MDLDKLKELLPSHTSGYFATIDGNRPDLRGWQFQIIENGKIHFATSYLKNVYKQMQENPNVAFACDVNGYYFRIYGKATFVTDKATMEKLHATHDPQILTLYPTINDNGYAVFCLEHGEVKYAKGFVPFESFTF